MAEFETFACERCGNVDATILAEGTQLCSRCRTGSWHGIWDEEKFDPAVHRGVVNRDSDTDPEELNDASFS